MLSVVYTECHFLLNVTFKPFMLSVIMLSVIMLSVIMVCHYAEWQAKQVPIRINQLPVSATGWQHGSYICFLIII
jgi:hypothetical protein